MSDVANGGQVLLDETTFLTVKDSLSVLGTVNESGYDDKMLQQLMHAQVVGKVKQKVGCAACARCGTRAAASRSTALSRCCAQQHIAVCAPCSCIAAQCSCMHYLTHAVLLPACTPSRLAG